MGSDIWQGAVADNWQVYTPTWTASGGGLANYTSSGLWVVTDGGVAHFWARCTANASGFNNGSGNYSVSLPTPATSTMASQEVLVDLFDNSTSGLYVADVRGRITASGTVVQLFCGPAAAGGVSRNVSNGTPFTWANSDFLTVQGTYRPA